MQKGVKGECFFQRMYAFALDVLNQLGFDAIGIRHLLDAHRHFFEGSKFRCPEPPRSDYDLKPLRVDGANQQGLQDAFRLDAFSQFVQCRLVESAARVGRGFLQYCDGQVAIFACSLNYGRHFLFSYL